MAGCGQALEEQLKRLKEKQEDRLREKDDIIYELNEQIKQKVAQMNQTELARKKELAELASQQAKLARTAGATQNKAAEERLLKKHQALAEKYEHVQNLLKLSQRENKTLKARALASSRPRVDKVSWACRGQDAAAAAASKPAADDKGEKKPAARELEEKLDKVSRKARVEELARKRVEESSAVRTRRARPVRPPHARTHARMPRAQEQTASLRKKTESQEQIIKALRDQKS